MKKSILICLTIIICAACFGQSKKDTASKKEDSVWSIPKVTILKFTSEQMEILNAIISNQDFSRKKFSEFLEEYNRQVNSQIIKVPAKK